MNLVLEFLESDLEIIIKDKNVMFKPEDIKSWMLMTLRGLDHCHRNWILHRVGRLQFHSPLTQLSKDMKPNNLLIASNGELKIADFGLARVFGEPSGNMTPQVVTRCV